MSAFYQGLLENESQSGLHSACVGAVRETLRLGAVADVGDAVGDHRPQDAKRGRVHLHINSGIVLRVERIESLEHQDRLYTLAEDYIAAETRIHAVDSVNVKVAIDLDSAGEPPIAC